MSLSTITSQDFPPKHKKFMRNEALSLKTQDIEGAQPRLKPYQYINRPDLVHNTSDIPGAYPRILHRSVERPYDSMTTDDIEKSKPKKMEFQTTRIGHNPLNPVYKLPSCEVRPHTPPKFIRDCIDITDIEGAKPEIYFKWKTRDHMNTHDIEGARPKPEQVLTKPNLNDPSDINKDGHFRTTRRTDPLNPEYQIRDENGNIVTIGNIPGNKSSTARRFHSTTHNRHLSAHDIEGATVGSARPKFVQTGRKTVKNPNDADDIPGAKAGTLKKGVKTSRVTDPLNPKYDIPGNSEEKPEQTPPKKAKPDNNSIQRSPTDPKYLKNEAAFWAVPPPQIKPDTAPQNSQRSVDSDFQRNVGKFFSRSGLATPQTDAREFKHNAELFFETSKDGKAIIEQNLFSKSSIHRAKPRRTDLDPDSTQFLQNSKKFFAASDSERSATDRNGVSSAQSISTEYRNNIQKFYDPNPNSAEALKMNSAKFFDGGQPVQPYVFKLSRSEIKQPGKPPINPLESSFKNNLAKFHAITPRQNSGRGLSLAVSASKFFE